MSHDPLEWERSILGLRSGNGLDGLSSAVVKGLGNGSLGGMSIEAVFATVMSEEEIHDSLARCLTASDSDHFDAVGCYGTGRSIVEAVYSDVVAKRPTLPDDRLRALQHSFTRAYFGLVSGGMTVPVQDALPNHCFRLGDLLVAVEDEGQFWKGGDDVPEQPMVTITTTNIDHEHFGIVRSGSLSSATFDALYRERSGQIS